MAATNDAPETDAPATDPELARARAFFSALADETRLRIYLMLAGGERCVCTIFEGLGIPQSNASRHLAILRAAGLVRARREGRWIYYRTAAPDDPMLQRLSRALLGAEPAQTTGRAARCEP